MDPQLHEDKKTELYIPPDKIEKLEDLEDNVSKDAPIIPPMDSDQVYALNQENFSIPSSDPNVVQYEPVAIPLESQAQQPSDAYQAVTDVSAQQKKRNGVGMVLSFLSVLLLAAFGTQLFLASQTQDTDGLKMNLAFSQCTNLGSPSLRNNYVNYCEIDGKYVYQDQEGTVIGRAGQVEQDFAKNGLIVFSTPQLAQFDKVTAVQSGNPLSSGVTAYLMTTPDTSGSVVVNNTYLKVPESSQNDLNLQRVKKFLDKESEFSGSEPLGEESLVLRAFQYQNQSAQSRTLEELSSESSVFSKSRSIWGVDGNGEEKFIVKARLFGIVRDNIVMIESGLPQSLQQKLLKETLLTCQQKNKAKADVQNCYIQEIKSNNEVKAAATNALQNILTRAGLN